MTVQDQVETYREVVVAKLEPDSEMGQTGEVVNVPGRETVWVRSNNLSWGGVPVTGRKNIARLRDALNAICAEEGIA